MELYQLIINQAANALDEDVGSGDISAQLIDADAILETELLVREDAVLCGCQWFDEVFRQCDEKIITRWRAGDGEQVSANTVVCEVAGPARAVLTAERSALNFLQTLSGTATRTREFADHNQAYLNAGFSTLVKPSRNSGLPKNMPSSVVAAAIIVSACSTLS